MQVKENHIYWLVFLIFSGIQLGLISHLQLFGDESFYWLEGQHLALSYAELPGWTAWMIRLGTTIFGNNYFAVRFFSYCAYLSLFYTAWLFNSRTLCWSIFSIPLLSVLAIMALPDIWLVFFVLWIAYFFKQAVATKQRKYWLIVGVLIALSINVHVRMWIWLFIAGLSFLFCYYQDKAVMKSLFGIVLPVSLLGFVPIVLFNIDNDFALFVFQFSSRHPWKFQIQNIYFLISQFIVITPLVLWLWFKAIIGIQKTQSKFIRWTLLTAFLHWILYVFLSLFADGFRTTVHWLLISYVPVLVLIPGHIKFSTKLVRLIIISGVIVSLFVLIFLTRNSINQTNLASRVFDNSSGWKQLAKVVQETQTQQNIDTIVTDYFMSASELLFELNSNTKIMSLEHEKNTKHGRQKQLEIMGMLLTKPQEFTMPALLVVEDSTLKLKNKGRYYHRLCQNFKQLRHLKSVAIAQSNKLFHLFKINAQGDCQLPPLFYVDQVDEDSLVVSGWVILHDVGIKSLLLVTGDKNVKIDNRHLKNLGISQQFPQIKDPNLPFNGFEITLNPNEIINNKFQIKAIGNDGKIYLSQNYYLN